MKTKQFLPLLIAIASITSVKAQDTLFRYFPNITKYVLIEDPDSLHSIDTAIDFFNRFHPADQISELLHVIDADCLEFINVLRLVLMVGN